MEQIEVDVVADPDLDEPTLIEGLPGVGHVGKLAAEHLLEEFDSELVRRVYADDFPPQVDIDDEGIAELTCAEFHAVHVPAPDETDEEDADETDGDASAESDETTDAEAAADADAAADGDDDALEPDGGEVGSDEVDGDGADGADLLVLTGDHQAQSNSGHYHLADAFLDIAEEFGTERVFALGGVPTGELVDEYNVLGAVTDAEQKRELEDTGVEFRENEPAGGIVGVSGMLLGLGARRGLDAACLMGETSGYLVDPKSARAVLEILQTVVGFDVDYASLEERAEEMEEVVGKIQEMQQQQQGMPSGDDLRYIG